MSVGYLPPAQSVRTSTGAQLVVAPAAAEDVGKVATVTAAGVVGWAAPGGGGGSPSPILGQATPTALTQSASAGGKWAYANSWGGGGGLIVPGTYGFGFAAAGWYQVSVMLWAGFTGAAPSFLRCSFQTYDYAEAFGDFPVLPAPPAGITGTTTSRSLPGVVATMTSPVFYQDDAATTGDDVCRVLLAWDSAGVLASATGGADRFALRADIARIA